MEKLEFAVAGYLIKNRKILLIHHKKLNMWLPPGGHVDEGETPDETLLREFKEELGINVYLKNIVRTNFEFPIIKECAVPFYTNAHSVGDHVHYCNYYLCSQKEESKININSKEINKYDWFSEIDLLQKKDISKNVKDVGIISLNL